MFDERYTDACLALICATLAQIVNDCIDSDKDVRLQGYYYLFTEAVKNCDEIMPIVVMAELTGKEPIEIVELLQKAVNKQEALIKQKKQPVSSEQLEQGFKQLAFFAA